MSEYPSEFQQAMVRHTATLKTRSQARMEHLHAIAEYKKLLRNAIRLRETEGDEAYSNAISDAAHEGEAMCDTLITLLEAEVEEERAHRLLRKTKRQGQPTTPPVN